MSLTEVGRRRPRADAYEQVTGKVQYAKDLYLTRRLYAKPLLSTEQLSRIILVQLLIPI